MSDCPLCKENGSTVTTLNKGSIELRVIECPNIKCRVNTYKYNPNSRGTRVFSRHKKSCMDWGNSHSRCD